MSNGEAQPEQRIEGMTKQGNDIVSDDDFREASDILKAWEAAHAGTPGSSGIQQEIPAAKDAVLIPLIIKDSFDTGLIESLTIALEHVASLPENVKDCFETYFENDDIDDIAQFRNGLLKLQQGKYPNSEELFQIGQPNDALEEVFWGLSDLMEREGLDAALVLHMEQSIIHPLELAIKQVEDWSDETRAWTNDLVEERYPDCEVLHSPPTFS
jgi:hypothetical protein